MVSLTFMGLIEEKSKNKTDFGRKSILFFNEFYFILITFGNKIEWID